MSKPERRPSPLPLKLSKSCMSMRKFTPGQFENDGADGDQGGGTTGNKKRVTITASTDTSSKPMDSPPPIVRMGRSNVSKFIIPDSDKVFQFKCSGEIGGDSLLAGKRVEWKAKFDRPLEELIYPSLQRFDLTDYERRMRSRTKHLNDHSGSAKTPSKIKYFNNHETDSQVRLEPIPSHLLPANQDIVYVHTPQWTVKVTDNQKPRSRSSTRDLTDDPAAAAAEAAARFGSIAEELDVEGEVYLRGRMRASILEREEERIRKEKLAMGFLMGLTSRRPAIDLQPVVLSATDNANVLYAQLLKQGKDKEELSHNSSPTKEDIYETELSAFHRQKKELSDSIPADQKHLLNGLLYYRHSHENHKAQMQAQRDTEQTLMKTFKQRDHGRRKSVNSLMQRMQKRRTSQFAPSGKDGEPARVNLLEMIREESAAQNMTHERFTRVQRALDARNVGLKQEDFGAVSPSKRSAAEVTTASMRRSGVLFTTDTEEATYIEQEYQHTVAQNNLRHAQDKLLLQQLDKGVLPERFIRSGVNTDDPRHVSVILSKYGIGDTRGVCLGRCLAEIKHLDCLGLSDNRLTSISLPTIIENISYGTLLALDLSFNNMHGTGMQALASYFKAKTVLQDIDLSNCGLVCSDIKILCTVLSMYTNHLEEVRLSCNSIGEEGAHDICNFLMSSYCHVDVLDLSWNVIGEKGAITFSNCLPSNHSLSELNLASNSLGDNGGQRIIKSLKYHQHMTKFNVSQNEIADGSCFVAAQILKGHKTLTNFDLTFNPLGEAGARSIFRAILRGVKCWIFMGNCTFRENPAVFNNTYPSLGNPYTLDLSEPYKAAVLEELMIKYVEDTANCSFENLVYRETLKGGPEQHISLAVVNNKVVVKNTNEVWVPPDKGFVKFVFHEVVAMPSVDDAISDHYLDLLMKIVEAGKESDRKKDVDKKRVWLYLLCQDVYLTTAQAQSMIDRFYDNSTIGDGELTKLDILKSVWKCLLDTENMYDFLYRNTNEEQRRDLVYALTLKRYKFNWSNPTAHWSLNLDDKTQRAIMMQIIAINNFESEYSKNHSGRGDTSQQGNWFNFRNCKYTVNKETKEILIDKDFVKHLPTIGTIDFDYVSTTRPVATVDKPLRIITEDELYIFYERLGLSSRKKVTNANSLFVLMDLQLASAGFYFTVDQVHTMLDAFDDHWELQARVIVCMFCRIVDIHRMDVLLRHLDRRAQQEVIRRIGCLNLINPLKPSFDYALCLKYLDNRILLITLMELASIESADQIIEDPSTELPIATMYGAYNRTLNETRPETMKFLFTDFGKRTKNVNWASRKDLIRKFLVGTQPIDEQLYHVITMYKELEAEGKLTEGPIDLQYMNYQRQLKSAAHRVTKHTKSMINTMRLSKR